MLAWGGAAVGLLLARICTPRQITLFVSAYLFSMILLSPDLDLSDSRATRRWGRLRWVWKPYALLFRHRRLSHHLVWGPMTRILYLALWGAVLVLVLHRTSALGSLSLRATLKETIGLALGLFLPNAEHVLLDRLGSSWRRRRGHKRL